MKNADVPKQERDQEVQALTYFVQRNPSEASDRESSKVVVLKTLEGVTDEWQAHLGCFLANLASCRRSRSRVLEVSSIVGLINLVGREVGRVDVRQELGLERRTDPAKSVEFNAAEEFVALDLVGSSMTKTVLRVADKAESSS